MKKLETEIGLRRYLANRLQPVTLLTWLLISIGFPTIGYIQEVNQLKQTGNIYAEKFAEKIKDLVLEEPSLWKYQNYKYNQIIRDALPQNKVAAIQVLDDTGQPTLDYEHTNENINEWWNLSAPIGSAPIVFNNRQVGTVQVTLSQNALLKQTLVFFVLSTTVATGLAALSYLFPIKIVQQMEGQIQNLFQNLQDAKTESDRLGVIAQASEQRFRDLVQGVDAIVWEADARTRRFSFVSKRAEEILGYPVEQWLSADFHFKYIHPDDQQQVEKLYQLAILEAKEQVIEYRAIAADGRVLWLRDLVQVVMESKGQVQFLRGVTVDVTQFKRAEEQLLHDALHDVLTGLPNRALFMHRLGQVVELAKRHQERLFAVLFLDLDGFKVINDSLGHRVGDQLLIEISRRLEKCVRSSDVVARLGGDEFVILLEDLKDVSDATYTAERIHQELALPFNLGDRNIFAATSIGIALSTTGYDSADNLVRDADMAMYYAKSLGKASHQVFDPVLHNWSHDAIAVGK